MAAIPGPHGLVEAVDPIAEANAQGNELAQQIWLTPKEAAAYVRRTPNAFYMWRMRNRVAACVRYRRTALDAILALENKRHQRKHQLPRRAMAAGPVSHKKVSA